MAGKAVSQKHLCNCTRRDFLVGAGASAGLLALTALPARGADAPAPKTKARVRTAFLYPPSETFSQDPDGWWSWPGNEYDAEGRQKKYTAKFRKIERKLAIELDIMGKPLATDQQVQTLARDIQTKAPDGLLLIMFYNRSLHHADLLLKAAQEASVPVIFYIGLGVKHGQVAQYRRPGVYFIQSLDNYAAIESGLRMIHTKKQMSQARLLSITEAPEPRVGTEGFFGTTVRVTPFSEYETIFWGIAADQKLQDWINQVKEPAQEIRGLTKESMENAGRAYFALRALLDRHQADGLTMNCLRRGMLKPCVGFSLLNNQLIPAACENDLPATYTQLLGQLLIGRPGFQHNPCFDTERNSYYASHCTCATRLYGPEGPARPYLLRRFAHTNEGSTAIQVFWKPKDPITMLRYHPGKAPKLDVYAGRVLRSHPMPPAAGCTTNVEVEVTDRTDACMVQGHHNLIFCGDFARRFRLFARLHKLDLADTGQTRS